MVGGGGGVLGPSGNLPTNPIKQGIKGGAPKVTKKQPFCSVGGGGGLLGPYLISPTRVLSASDFWSLPPNSVDLRNSTDSAPNSVILPNIHRLYPFVVHKYVTFGL